MLAMSHKNKPQIVPHGWFLEMSPKHQSVSEEIKGFPFQKKKKKAPKIVLKA